MIGYRERSHGGYHSRESGCHAGGGDDDLDAAVACSACKLFDLGGRTVGAESVHFEWNLHLLQKVGSFAQDRQVGGAAHNDAYKWCHIIGLK